ncbi:MAG: aspartate aminotransferase family protein, partial [Pseudomonadota bacterium]|nr:aspartate aminotransferase family protein [Pseudomonadota bacterium]
MTISQDLVTRADVSLPGGVNSPVRALNGVGGTPLVIPNAEGPFTFDADGN